jgi:ABC-type transport system substrate-binding protein
MRRRSPKPGGNERRLAAAIVVVFAALVALASADAREPARTFRERPPSSPGLQIGAPSDFDFIDPALAFFNHSWQLEDAICARLVRYANDGSLVPEIALGPPAVSSDGRTYTFTIRPGFRFSPPSGETVTAQTFKYSIERALAPGMFSPAASYMTDLAGFDAYRNGQASSISGLTVSGNALAFHLTAAHGDLVARLTMPFFCPVPIGTPVDPAGVGAPLASTGPYYVANWTHGVGAQLLPNPYYGGLHPARWDEIDYTFGWSIAAASSAVEDGMLDYTTQVPASQIHRLRDDYGQWSEWGLAGRQRFFETAGSTLWYLALNTARTAFANASLRAAVANAVDRVGIASEFGEDEAATTDQILPTVVPGYVPWSIYLPTSNFVAAQALAASQGVTQATPISVNLYTFNTQIGLAVAARVQQALAPIGINVTVQAFPLGTQIAKLGTPGEPYDIAFTGWAMDYADPADLLDALLNGARRPPNGSNYSQFDDGGFNTQLEQAAVIPPGPARWNAYAQLDLQLSQAAPIVALLNPRINAFTSDRVGCQVLNPRTNLDLAQLCPR